MPFQASVRARRPRELRRRVMLRARIRAGAVWNDTCILNVSSRGLMINASTAAHAQKGSKIELRHGDHVILAEVVWRDGRRAGLRSDERVPVEEIMALSKAPSLQLTAAGQWPHVDRRRRPRRQVDSRTRSRAMEFAGVAAVAVCLSGAAFVLVEQAFAKPMAYVEAALGG